MDTETEKEATALDPLAPFRRDLVVAKLPEGHVPRSVWVSITWDGKRLSFTGVEGPKRNGNAAGGCGQIQMPAEHHGDRIPQYDRIAELWARWHLNDMRAGCEHQRAAGWGDERVEIVTYRLTREAQKEQRLIRKGVNDQIAETGRAEVTEEQRLLLALPWETIHAPDADSVGSGRYEVHKRDTRGTNWLAESEHPRGVLAKPCPECGYKYGTKWLHEDVPVEVLVQLRSLPDQSGQMPRDWRG